MMDFTLKTVSGLGPVLTFSGIDVTEMVSCVDLQMSAYEEDRLVLELALPEVDINGYAKPHLAGYTKDQLEWLKRAIEIELQRYNK